MALGFAALALLAALAGQAFAGWHDFNNDQLRHQSPAISFGRYVVSSEFGRAILENWQSEYLQFTLYILGTVWLLQRGSPESKELDKAGTESHESQQVGRHDARSPRWARTGPADHALLQLTPARDGRHLACFLAGSVDHRPQLLQRAALRAPPGRALLPAVPG